VSQGLLRIDKISKSFGGVHVTKGLSLEVANGDVHAIIGPNGAGKTSLIDQISGRVLCDSGRIFLDSLDISELPIYMRARLGLARCFQISSILPSFTALQNVAVAVQARSGLNCSFVRNPDNNPQIVNSARDTLALVGLKGREDVVAQILSHGEKRQLELALALATKPRIILLDEPLAGTGTEEAKHLIKTLAQLRGRVTMLLIEHDMQAVFALADRVSVLVHGELIASGQPDAIRANPEVRAAYLGSEN
jgi:branched-chain amino acid transport system ATP-binding protein